MKRKLGYKLITAIFTACIVLSIQAQEIEKHPLDGVWKWESVDDDGNTSQGFRWYWTDSVVGVQRVAQVSIDSETLEPIQGWSVFQTVPVSGIGDRLWCHSNGHLGRSTERFMDNGSVVTFSGVSSSGNVSGQIEISWNERGDFFKEQSNQVVGPGRSYQDETPVIQAHKINYNPAEQNEIVWARNKMPVLDERLKELHGTWESFKTDGSINLRTRFSRGNLGSSLHERWVFFDEEGNPAGAGYNLTRRNHSNDELVMWSINKNGFSRVGGWDFMGGLTTGQRQGNGRLIRSFLSDNEIYSKWQSKENGNYTDTENSYVLKKVQVSNDENIETKGEKTQRSYFQRSQESERFTGFLKTDFKVVKEKDIAAYLAAEQEWKGLHEQRMEKGALIHWHLAKIVNAEKGEPNFATVQVYATMEDMQNQKIWDELDYTAVGSREDLGSRTWPFVQAAGSDVHQAVDQYWSPDSGTMDISRISRGYMNVKSGKQQEYLSAERTRAKPFFQVVSNLDPSFGAWAMHRLIQSTRPGVNHDFATLHFKSDENLPDQETWQSNIKTAMTMINKPEVNWDSLREMSDGPEFEIILKTDSSLRPVKNEWDKLIGSWKHTHDDGSYRIKRITHGTEQLETYDSDGQLINKVIVPMKIEIKGGLNHFYAYHSDFTYHSIYKVHDNKWYEQMRGIWRNGNGDPTKFLVYEKL